MENKNHKTRYLINPIEEKLVIFEGRLKDIGPKHPLWMKRVAIELKNLQIVLDSLAEQPNGIWFKLWPRKDKKYNFQVWDGELLIPGRPEISFELRVILSSEYPYVFPRAFAEESMIKYAGGNMYVQNIWNKDETKNFVMICHDHMREQDAWDPRLTMAHFLIRELWYWWNSKIDQIIKIWDETHL